MTQGLVKAEGTKGREGVGTFHPERWQPLQGAGRSRGPTVCSEGHAGCSEGWPSLLCSGGLFFPAPSPPTLVIECVTPGVLCTLVQTVLFTGDTKSKGHSGRCAAQTHAEA